VPQRRYLRRDRSQSDTGARSGRRAGRGVSLRKICARTRADAAASPRNAPFTVTAKMSETTNTATANGTRARPVTTVSRAYPGHDLHIADPFSRFAKAPRRRRDASHPSAGHWTAALGARIR
jgi:hypothetical protein